ncbi:copper transport protein Ctr2p [Monosporozyma unispora]|nr:hypothetical protein C6P44_005448 [Kazachstania unispora]
MKHHMDMDMDMCSMNMSFTWSYHNTCIIFNWWKIKNLTGLILSCLTLILISISYEWFRYRLQVYNSKLTNVSRLNPNQRAHSSVLYGVQVGFSFMLMLVFMTYNGWLMLSVVVGAILGHYIFGYKSQLTQLNNPPLLGGSMACH